MKNADPHMVPLSPAAIEILNKLPRVEESQTLFVARRGASPIGDVGRVKERLDQQITALNAGQSIAHWSLHDCRRTLRTGLSSLGVATHIAELCLGHKQRGIVAVYDVHRYERERRDAVERWSAHLASIVGPTPDNVVRLRTSS
jgi:integrase